MPTSLPEMVLLLLLLKSDFRNQRGRGLGEDKKGRAVLTSSYSQMSMNSPQQVEVGWKYLRIITAERSDTTFVHHDRQE